MLFCTAERAGLFTFCQLQLIYFTVVPAVTLCCSLIPCNDIDAASLATFMLALRPCYTVSMYTALSSQQTVAAMVAAIFAATANVCQIQDTINTEVVHTLEYS